ncbi:MAG: hypothetical protein ACPGJS_10755 [Flammeovirgaceae bacterium]
MKNQKIGGVVGIIEAILYVIGIAFLFLFLSPAMDETKSGIDKLSFILENKTLFQIWHLLIYVIFGLLLLPLAIAINENFKTQSLIGTKVTPILGFIWSGLVIASGMVNNIGLETVNKLFLEDQAGALMAWKIISSIQNGLGGGVEIVGGLWVLLISVYGLREQVFPKPLNYLGLIVGGAGILTMIPGLKDLGLIFGMTQIIWFAWIGMYMLKNQKQVVTIV